MKVQLKIQRAFHRFMENERYLLESETNERSITHRFAVQIERLFPGYNVDCEFNRDGMDAKRLRSFRRQISSDDTRGVTVYPDIIVHLRGTPNNLVVIEAKTSSSDSPCSTALNCRCDRCKLRAFKSDLHYNHAFYVVFPVGDELANYSPANLQNLVTPI